MIEPIPLGLTMLTAAGYLAGIRWLRRRGPRWPRARSACLPAGTLGMAAPALLALSAPVTLALRTAPPGARRVLLRVLHSRLAAFLTAPTIAVTVNLGGLFALYLTHLYAAAERCDLVHAAVHLHMFAAGRLLSWALIGTDPVRRRPAVHVRVTALVVSAAGHDFLSKFMYAQDLGTLIDAALAVIIMAL